MMNGTFQATMEEAMSGGESGPGVASEEIVERVRVWLVKYFFSVF